MTKPLINAIAIFSIVIVSINYGLHHAFTP